MTWWLWVIVSTAYVVLGCGAYTVLLPHRYKIRFRKHRDRKCGGNCPHRNWRNEHGEHYSSLEKAVDYQAQTEAEVAAFLFSVAWPVSTVGYGMRYSLAGIGWVLWAALGRPTDRIASRRVERVREKEGTDS